MVDLQVISKIINTKSLRILEDNNITKEYFPEYQEEIQYVLDHYDKYGNVPDRSTFLSEFPDIELVEVAESDQYLVDHLREEYLYFNLAPVLNRAAEMSKTDSNLAVEYLVNAFKTLQPEYDISGMDIIQQAQERYDQYLDRKNHQDEWFFTTGFPELDDVMHGIQRQEEFLVIFARTNQGKSFILEKICTHIWEIGFNVGYISPEMSANSIGYRFDTLYRNFSNKGLMWAKNGIDDQEYQNYIEELQKRNNKFIVATPADFGRQITVTKLKNWKKKYNLDCIAIDGITYLTDERYKRGDNKTTMLTNISEDLIALSVELKIPVLVVAQANRNGVVDNDKDAVPELESIRDCDGIAMNATKVLSMRQTKENVLKMEVKKQRFGPVGVKVAYNWDIDTGTFTYVPITDSDADPAPQERKERGKKKQAESKEDVF